MFADVPVVSVESLESRVLLAADFVLPADALLPDLKPIADSSRSYIYGYTLDRSEQPGHVLLRLSTAMENLGAGPVELTGGDHSAEGQQVFQVIHEQSGATVQRLAGVFVYHPQHHHVHFNDFANYKLRAVTADGGIGDIVKSATKISFCLTDSDQVDDALPGSPPFSSYDECGVTRQGISVGWADVYDSELPDQWIDVTGVKAGKYWLEVTVDPKNHLLESDETNNTVDVQIDYAPPKKPINDDFGRATSVPSAGFSVTGDTTAATHQSRDPLVAGVRGGASVWYRWKASKSGKVSVNTTGSEIDTLLGVYLGTSLHDLQTVAANDDDASAGRASRVMFEAKAGAVYYIMVDGFRGAAGKYKLTLTHK